MILRNGKTLFDEYNKKRKKIDLEQNKNESLIFVNKRKKIEQRKRKNIEPEEQEKVAVKKSIKIMEMNKERAEEAMVEKRDLPEDLLIENILTRLPLRDLAACSFVSKLWCNSIYRDKRFAAAHLVHNQNKCSLFLHLLYNPRSCREERTYLFRLAKNRHGSLAFKRSVVVPFQFKYELVGYCSGLACFIESELDDDTGTITVLNPTRHEILGLTYSTPPVWEYTHLCHGFGFDPLSQGYKVVLVFTSEANDKFLCMVITLGTSPPWREITMSTVEMLPPQSSSFPSRFVTRVSKKFCPSTSGTLCGSDLFWRVTISEENTDKHHESRLDTEIEMLLSFNLHNEKIQFIRFPPQSTQTTTMNEQPCLVLDHLLDFKGYPCVARSEKTMMLSNIDGHPCCDDNSSCCCCKVHLYILKDKGKQAWIKAETFDLRVREEGLLAALLRCYSDATSTTIPPAQVLTFSDQVLLYWFNGERLVLYNLQKRHLQVVRGSSDYPDVFRTKMNGFPAVGSDNATYYPYMDYRLQTQVDNILSLKSFIPPDGVIIRTKCRDDFIRFITDRPLAGWVTSGKASPEYHGFL